MGFKDKKKKKGPATENPKPEKAKSKVKGSQKKEQVSKQTQTTQKTQKPAQTANSKPPKKKSKQREIDMEDYTIINMFRRFARASKMRKKEEGADLRKLYRKRKEAIMAATRIESTLRAQFNECVERINNGESRSFTIKLEREALPFLDAIISDDAYKHLIISEVGDRVYKISLKPNDLF